MAGNYVNYSPWQDAAGYGRGLGDVLVQALLQSPQRKMEVSQQQQRFPLEQELLKAQINNQNFRPQQFQDTLDLKNRVESDRNDYQSGQLDLKQGQLNINQALAAMQELLKPKQVAAQQETADASMKRADTAAEKQPSLGSTLKDENSVSQMLMSQGQKDYPNQPGSVTNSPSMDVVGKLTGMLRGLPPEKIAGLIQSFIKPNVQTNTPTMMNRMSGGMIGSPGGVVTNGPSFALPSVGTPPLPNMSSGNVPPPEQRPVGFVTTTVKGKFIWDGQSWQSTQ